MGSLVIFLCVILWGISTFLNRLSVETASPLVLQIIVGFGYVLYLPIALKISGVGNPLEYRWSTHSLILTACATVCSILANVMLYGYLKGSNQTGAHTMLLSLYPVVTLLLSAVFLHEHFNITRVLGVMTMIVGAILLSWK
jgi:drug/metabolite transporter (DMT)-like permease